MSKRVDFVAVDQATLLRRLDALEESQRNDGHLRPLTHVHEHREEFSGVAPRFSTAAVSHHGLASGPDVPGQIHAREVLSFASHGSAPGAEPEPQLERDPE